MGFCMVWFRFCFLVQFWFDFWVTDNLPRTTFVYAFVVLAGFFSTLQTYERSSIQKWLDAGHKTCPKSQETLLHSGLTPNYVLKSLIALWCESNGIELPQNQGSSYRTTRPGGGSSSSDCDRAFVLALLEKLANGSTEQQRAAAGELRLLA